MALTFADRAMRGMTLSGFAAITSLVAMCAFAQSTTESSVAPANPANPPAALPSQPVSNPAMLPAPMPAHQATNKNVPATAKATATAARPLWSELTPAQKLTLAPLAGEWDALDSFRKKKWLEISAKFPTMKPDEQQRMQERMHEWAKLTPDQRRVARESFVRNKKLDPQQKSEQWQQYQQLPEEQKKKLAADANVKKPVARLPSSQNPSTTLPPIKATPKPVLEMSVTPQATNQSDIGPTPIPENK